MRKIRLLLYCAVSMLAFSCKEPFNPPEVAAPPPKLVVEGVLAAGGRPTQLRLSLTTKLDRQTNIIPELNATVTVEGKDNTVQSLPSSGLGLYSSSASGLNLTIGKDYRVRIKRSNGKEYLSGYVTVKQTPAIDSIGWRRLINNGLEIYANAHDASNKTIYYRWDYDETWEIRSPYFTNLIYDGADHVIPRRPDQWVYQCWKYASSSTIVLGSSARLQDDIIRQAPITSFSKGDDKFSVRYSILLRQYAIDKNAYEFFDLMKKNTENLGSIFDPQPSELSGNFHGVTDPSEQVIGFVTASTVQENRYFITTADVGADWNSPPSCGYYHVKNQKDSIRAAFGGDYAIPYGQEINMQGDTTYFLGSDPACVDCTRRGGSTTKPPYW